MNKIYVYLRCSGQDLQRVDDATIAANAANTVYAKFDLCEKWQGLTVYARFEYLGRVFDVPLQGNECAIPSEVLHEVGFHVSIFGTRGDGSRLTSKRILIDVKPTIDWEGAEPIAPTPSLVERFEQLVNECQKVVDKIYSDAEGGRFNGKPFQIVKEYGTIAEMEADHANPAVEIGEFVIITSNVEDPDNSKLYLKTGKCWSFITDMSGMQGLQGAKGDSGTTTVIKTVTGAAGTPAKVENSGTPSDARLTFTIPQGIKGEKGDGIPYGGVAGQVLTKTESGTAWKNADENVKYPIPVDKGGTGSTSAAAARAALVITPANIGAAPSSHTHTPQSIGAAPSYHTHTPSQVGAAAAKHNHIPSECGITIGTDPAPATGTPYTVYIQML